MALRCKDTLRHIHVYLDGELTAEIRTVIACHLDECPSCFEAFGFETRFRQVVARCCQEKVPDSLRVRIVEAITSEIVVIEKSTVTYQRRPRS